MKKLLTTLFALTSISAMAAIDDCSVKVRIQTEPEIINALVVSGFRPVLESEKNEYQFCDSNEAQFCLMSNISKGQKKRRIGHDIIDTGLFIVTFGFYEGHDLLSSWKQDRKIGLNIHEARKRTAGPIRASVVSQEILTYKSQLGGESPDAKNLNVAISDLAYQIESSWECSNGEISILN